MKISYNWLKTLIKLDMSLEDMCERLTMSGLEVEHITEVSSIKGGLKGLVVGEVMSKDKHPNADKLSITKVKVQEDRILDIVCGAPNVDRGQKVVVATVGTTIHPLKGDSFEIKKAKIRGEKSEGMICAEDEIGLGASHDGIMILNQNAEVGSLVSELFNIETDHQIEIAIIPNRGDAISHVGVARELQALTGQRYKRPGTVTFDARGAHKIEIELNNQEACQRYTGITLTNVKVGPSPDWLKNRLISIGLNPINNVVDVTNFIQHEIGQPIHAFDYDKIEGKTIIVRDAKANETITTLDEQERELIESNLVICDSKKPIAIAGVLGGLDSGVSEKSKNIFIESAYFDPTSIRKTAKHFGLNTDASYRYERGTDPNITEHALRRVVNLLQDIADAEIGSEITDLYPNPIADKEIAINLDELNQFTGHEIPKDDVVTILTNLEIQIGANNRDSLMLHVPPYRPDVDRPVDIYEEVLRIYGFDNIPIPAKVNYIPSVIDPMSANKLQTKISDYLSSLGFNEIMSNSLTSADYYSEEELSKSIPMLNPLSKDMGILRMDLLDSALESVAYNLNRKNADLTFYEFGKVYRQFDGKYVEDQILQLTATGRLHKEHWNTSTEAITIHQLLGIAENVLRKLNIANKQFKKIISIAAVSKKKMKVFGIKQEVLVVQINWDKCLALSTDKMNLTEIPKFPVVRRDLSLVLDKTISYKEIRSIVNQSTGQYLKDLNLFDVYEGKPLESGQRSYSIAVSLYDAKKTMEDQEIDKVMNKLIDAFKSKLNATIRS